jgi:hypothetical protein
MLVLGKRNGRWYCEASRVVGFAGLGVCLLPILIQTLVNISWHHSCSPPDLALRFLQDRSFNDSFAVNQSPTVSQ